jgi:hypothetical protein
MANETLSGATIVEYSNDIPMTVNEVFLTSSIVEVVRDIPMTVNEANLNISIVEGVNEIPPKPSIKRNVHVGKCVLGKLI